MTKLLILNHSVGSGDFKKDLKEKHNYFFFLVLTNFSANRPILKIKVKFINYDIVNMHACDT